jgi:hypothetical protein
MVSIFVLMNIDILKSHVKKDYKKNYKIYCEYDPTGDTLFHAVGAILSASEIRTFRDCF